jgi:hypothetical protein
MLFSDQHWCCWCWWCFITQPLILLLLISIKKASGGVLWLILLGDVEIHCDLRMMSAAADDSIIIL